MSRLQELAREAAGDIQDALGSVLLARKAKEAVGAVEAEIAAVEAEAEAVRGSIPTADAGAEAAVAEWTRLAGRLATLCPPGYDWTRAMGAERDGLANAVNAAATACRAAKHRADGLRRRVDALEAKLGDLRAELAELRAVRLGDRAREALSAVKEALG